MELYTFSTAQKVFLFLTFLQMILTFYNLAVIFFTGLNDIDILATILAIITTLGSLITLMAIFGVKPPYNLAIYPATISSLILAILSSNIQVPYLCIGVLILYFQIRHPISLDKSLQIQKRKTQKAKRV